MCATARREAPRNAVARGSGAAQRCHVRAGNGGAETRGVCAVEAVEAVMAVENTEAIEDACCLHRICCLARDCMFVADSVCCIAGGNRKPYLPPEDACTICNICDCTYISLACYYLYRTLPPSTVHYLSAAVVRLLSAAICTRVSG